jgi:hypothetical protein
LKHSTGFTQTIFCASTSAGVQH